MSTEAKVVPKIRKPRNDRGVKRPYYTPRGSTNPTATKPESLNTAPKESKIPIQLSKYERAVMGIVKENYGLISAMGDGSLPFVIGMLVAKSIELIDDHGTMRKRLVKSTFANLVSLKKIKIRMTNQFPLGPGRIELA